MQVGIERAAPPAVGDEEGVVRVEDSAGLEGDLAADEEERCLRGRNMRLSAERASGSW